MVNFDNYKKEFEKIAKQFKVSVEDAEIYFFISIRLKQAIYSNADESIDFGELHDEIGDINWEIFNKEDFHNKEKEKVSEEHIELNKIDD